MRWSETITARRIRWFGHMARLPVRTPARRVMDEVLLTETKKPRGGQKTTWTKLITKDLAKANLTIEQSLETARDRSGWRGIVHALSSNTSKRSG